MSEILKIPLGKNTHKLALPLALILVKMHLGKKKQQTMEHLES